MCRRALHRAATRRARVAGGRRRGRWRHLDARAARRCRGRRSARDRRRGRDRRTAGEPDPPRGRSDSVGVLEQDVAAPARYQRPARDAPARGPRAGPGRPSRRHAGGDGARYGPGAGGRGRAARARCAGARRGRVSGLRIEIRGIVQGVGFRPWVYRIAHELGVAGRVHNHARGVTVDAFAGDAVLATLVARLRAAPAPAQVRDLVAEPIPDEPAREFVIGESAAGGERVFSIPPDLATCPDCEREIRDPANRRHGYACTNCTHCGPRFTSATGVPDDRPATTMAPFAMCPACRREYDDPRDRRFHAQPNACPVCGPRLALWSSTGALLPEPDPLAAAVARLTRGEVVAVRGLGGCRVACRARGYVPRAIAFPRAVERPVLAVGALLKNTFCIAAGDSAYLGPHIGDLENLAALEFFEAAVARMETILGVHPEVIAHDLHPGYASTQFARARPALRCVGVQHHHAHIASAMAEHGLTGAVIGVAYDGTGWGTDGTAWGGEILHASYASYERMGTFRHRRWPSRAAWSAVRATRLSRAAWADSSTESARSRARGRGRRTRARSRSRGTSRQPPAITAATRSRSRGPRSTSGRSFARSPPTCSRASHRR